MCEDIDTTGLIAAWGQIVGVSYASFGRSYIERLYVVDGSGIDLHVLQLSRPVIRELSQLIKSARGRNKGTSSLLYRHLDQNDEDLVQMLNHTVLLNLA